MTTEKSEEALQKELNELFSKGVDLNRIELEDYAKKNNWEILEWLGAEPGKLLVAVARDISDNVFEIYLEERDDSLPKQTEIKKPPTSQQIEKSEFIRKVQDSRHRD